MEQGGEGGEGREEVSGGGGNRRERRVDGEVMSNELENRRH